MSQSAVERTLGKLATDDDFSARFFENPAAATWEAGLPLRPRREEQLGGRAHQLHMHDLASVVLLKRMLLLFAMTLTTIAGTAVAKAETATAEAPFRFQLAQADGRRGLGVEGFVYNGLPWRITNVRLRVEGVDADGTVTVSASGWVIGDVKACGRGYFYVRVSAPANTYRATVQSFDKVAVEAPWVQAP